MKIKFKLTKKSWAKVINIAHKIGKFLYGLIFVFLILVAGSIAISNLNIPGNYKIFTVQSGSMEPSIKTGSIVVIKPSENYNKGDVITVKELVNPKNTITHRVFEVKENSGKTFYITKGDANKAPDPEERPKENVIGKVILSVPFLGYPIGFAKTRDGLIILVIIPATIIVYSELMSIKNEVQKLIKARKKRKLTLVEKVELEIGEEEIKTEKWYKKIFKNIF